MPVIDMFLLCKDLRQTAVGEGRDARRHGRTRHHQTGARADANRAHQGAQVQVSAATLMIMCNQSTEGCVYSPAVFTSLSDFRHLH